MLGEPTTPPFSLAAFVSSEANHVRTFATSATSWRITTSFGSSARRNTLPFVMPAETRLFSRPSKRVWQAARRVDLFLWVDAQKRTCQHVCPDDAVHRAAACRLLGIEIGGQ